MMNLEKMPPSDSESERAFLACLLYNPKNIDTYKLDKSDFYTTNNAVLYNEICKLHKKQTCELSVLLIAIKSNTSLFNYCISLDLDDCIANDNSVKFYHSKIKSTAIRRKQIEISLKIFNDSYKENIDVNDSVEELKSIIDNAKTSDETGLITAADLFTEIDNIYENGFRRGLSTGWLKLDEYYTVRPGEISVITGVPSHGKSTMNTNIITNMAQRHHWKFAVFSPENNPMQRYCAHIAQIYTNKPFGKGQQDRISREELEIAKMWIDEHFVFIVPRNDELTIDSLIQKAKICILKYGVKGIVFDPWNEIDHSRPSGLTETEYISKCLTKIRYLARTYQVHIWLVAHPTKLLKRQDGSYPVPTPYDIAGSAHFRNKADNCLTVWRDLSVPGSNTKIYIQKIRFHEVGKIGEVEFHYKILTQSYEAVQ